MFTSAYLVPRKDAAGPSNLHSPSSTTIIHLYVFFRCLASHFCPLGDVDGECERLRRLKLLSGLEDLPLGLVCRKRHIRRSTFGVSPPDKEGDGRSQGEKGFLSPILLLKAFAYSTRPLLQPKCTSLQCLNGCVVSLLACQEICEEVSLHVRTYAVPSGEPESCR